MLAVISPSPTATMKIYRAILCIDSRKFAHAMIEVLPTSDFVVSTPKKAASSWAMKFNHHLKRLDSVLAFSIVFELS